MNRLACALAILALTAGCGMEARDSAECKIPGKACLLAVAKSYTHDDKVKVSLDGDTASVDYFTEILTAHLGKTAFNVTAEGLFDEVFTLFPEVQKITIQYRTKFVDERGQESIEPSERVTYTRANYESINWKNVRFDGIPRLADEFWAHPAYYRAEND